MSFALSRPVDAADHVLGPVQAALTLVEYGDFECPNCRQAAPAVKLLLRRFRRLRFAFRHFPLEGVHPHALDAALAAEAAGAQGRFWEMHDMLLENQAHLEPRELRGYAAALGLDLARYDAETRARTHLHRVREHIDSGRCSGVRATPTFYLDGRMQDVSFGLGALRDAVASRDSR